jgi:hypothetical protein
LTYRPGILHLEQLEAMELFIALVFRWGEGHGNGAFLMTRTWSKKKFFMKG